MEANTAQKLNMIEDDGTEKIVYFIPAYLTQAEADDLLSRYNPASGTSPSTADCRPLARAILDAILANR